MKRKLRYKGISVNMFGLPDLSKPISKREKAISKRRYLKSFTENPNRNTTKNLLVIYDIPEDKKKERDWFRRQLKNFDFEMIQRSVWIGPSPLPEDFLVYLKEVGLHKDFITFKLAKSYFQKQKI